MRGPSLGPRSGPGPGLTQPDPSWPLGAVGAALVWRVSAALEWQFTGEAETVCCDRHPAPTCVRLRSQTPVTQVPPQPRPSALEGTLSAHVSSSFALSRVCSRGHPSPCPFWSHRSGPWASPVSAPFLSLRCGPEVGGVLVHLLGLPPPLLLRRLTALRFRLLSSSHRSSATLSLPPPAITLRRVSSPDLCEL